MIKELVAYDDFIPALIQRLEQLEYQVIEIS